MTVEVADKKAFASALDWPGWSRSGKTEEAALAALDDHASRYAPIAKLALYEPPFFVDETRPPLPTDHLERLHSMGPDDSLEYFLT